MLRISQDCHPLSLARCFSPGTSPRRSLQLFEFAAQILQPGLAVTRSRRTINPFTPSDLPPMRRIARGASGIFPSSPRRRRLGSNTSTHFRENRLHPATAPSPSPAPNIVARRLSVVLFRAEDRYLARRGHAPACRSMTGPTVLRSEISQMARRAFRIRKMRQRIVARVSR